MKKLVAVMLVVVAVLSASCAFADDGEKMTFNDMKFSKNYKIKGYASINLLGFKFVNVYAQWKDGQASPNSGALELCIILMIRMFTLKNPMKKE